MTIGDPEKKTLYGRRLVLAILIVGFVAGCIMLAAFGRAIYETHAVQSETNELAKVMDDIVDSTGRWEKRVSPETAIDWVKTRQHIVAQAEKIASFGVASMQFDALLSAMDKVMECRRDCAEWRARQIDNEEAAAAAADKVQRALARFRETVDSMAGKQRLARAVLLSKLRTAQETSKQTAQQVFGLEQRAAALPRGQIDLADLSLLVEQLLRQADPDRLADLKDNQFRNIIARMQRELPFDGDVAESFADEFNAIFAALFGIDGRMDEEHQTIAPGGDGVYRLREQTIKLTKERQDLLDQATKSLAASRAEQDRFNQSVRQAMQARAQQVNASSFHAWIVTAIVTLICGATFGGLATKISRTLNRQVEEIKAANVAVVEHARELAAAKDQAEAFSRCKSEFLANMSHEIRTPMTAILGYADVLLEEGDLSKAPENRIEAICTIQRNGTHLLQIINDILDLSKIEAGKMTVESAPCSPIQLLADVESLMRVRAESKGLALEIECEGELPETIHSDPTRLRQILVNLVGNAVKFTEQGGVRVVARLVRRDEPRLEFDVVDSGVGMTPEQTHRLFQAFSQADATTTRRFGGTGLGLVISKRLAEMLGGDVTVADTKAGVGSTFRLTLSIGSLADAKLVYAYGGPASLVRERPAIRQEAFSERLAGRRILLAEDGVDNQRLIAFVLHKSHAEVVSVENGQMAVAEALAAVESGRPFDVVLMDMQMPVMDGYQAVALLRAKGYRRPIVALTAHAMSGDRQRCVASGCDDYASKPIDRAALIEQIAAWAANAEQLPNERLVTV